MSKKEQKNKKEENKDFNELIIDEAVRQYKEGNIKNYADVTKFLDKLYQPLMQRLLDAELDNHLDYSKYEHKKDKKDFVDSIYCFVCYWWCDCSVLYA